MDTKSKHTNAFDAKLYKEKLLTTFKAFIKFCEDNDLNYYGAFGTVLGAVRHKGLIPWDDDIDVYMPREDYDKFLKLRQNALEQGYNIVDARLDDCYCPYAKFCDANTTIWEVKENPYLIGVFIDVFPFDQAPSIRENTMELRKQYIKRYDHYALSLKDYVSANAIRDIRKGKLFHVLKMVIKKCIYNRYTKQHFKNKWLEIDNKTRNIKGRIRMFYYTWDINMYVGMYPKEWFDGYEILPFEDFEIRVPKDYYNYLIFIYGDYMTPPPPEKRFSQHYHYFIDLEHGYTIEECKEIIRHMNPNDLEQKDLSYLIQ